VNHKAGALYDRIYQLEGEEIHTGTLLKNLEIGLGNRFLHSSSTIYLFFFNFFR
jgi:hypothetical protein